MEERKYLDQEGVKFLWSKLSMEDYPNNDTLMAVINAIDETKANKDDFTTEIWTFTLANGSTITKEVVIK